MFGGNQGRVAGCADPSTVPRASCAEPAGKQLLPPVQEPEWDHAGPAADVQPVHTSDHIGAGCKHSGDRETRMHQHFLRHCVCTGFGRGKASRMTAAGSAASL